LSLAMVEYAIRHKMTAADFPINAWTYNEDPEDYQGDPWAFIMQELALTDRERENVRYCMERCSLAKVYA